MVLQLLNRCFNSVTNRFFYTILSMTLLITIAIFTGLYFSISIFIETNISNLFEPKENTTQSMSSIGTFVISYALFPLTIPIISSLFSEKIFAHIESKHYKISINSKINNLTVRLIKSVIFIFKIFLLNIIAFPLYLIPIIGTVLYYYINSYFFGKEYFNMTALRYSEIKTTEHDYKANKKSILITGLLICLMSTFPIINLFAPILAIIIMAHLYHTKISKLNYHK